MNHNIYVEELIKLESLFTKAGALAVELQNKAKSYNKFSTGKADFDIVTKADLEIQEFILQAMAKTPLRACQLFAEENTPSVKLFKGAGNLFLTLDPINGTSLYADGKKYWNIIIALHDERDFLYTISLYPTVSWTNKIIGKKYESIGQKPKIHLLQDGSKTIVYSYGITDVIDRKLYHDLILQGYNFKLRKELTDESGSTTLLQTGQVAGYFNSKPLVYDGLVSLHYAQAMGYKIYSFGSRNELDLAEVKKDQDFLYHPGYYIVLVK